MIVYADELLVLNLLVNYLLLLACGRLSGGTVRHRRLWLGAGLGALYALAALLPQLGYCLTWGMKAAVLVGMVLLAYGHCPRLWRYVLLFLAMSAAYAGAVFLAGTLLGAQVCVRNGILCYPVSYRAMVLTLCLTYGAVSLVLRNRLTDSPRQILPLELQLGDRRVCTTALLDTGNELRDPLTGQGVTVAEAEVAAQLLEGPARDLLRASMGLSPPEVLVQLHGAAPGLRLQLFRFQSLGAEGLLLALGCDRVRLGERECPGRWVAVTSRELSVVGDYHALAGQQERSGMS